MPRTGPPQPHRQRTESHSHETGTTVGAPSEIRAGVFDRFAEAASEFASHARFFVACVLLVALWAPSYFLFGSLDTWQLVINTATTIVTFLMVALLQNAQRRSDVAMHEKLNALAEGLADFMEHSGPDNAELQNDMRELRAAVGLERP
jgi:cytochrome c-type biogenesis protein CcmH/NrfG